MIKIKSKKVEGIISEIIDQYAYADKSDRPWIIGFSGGKDSTVLLTLVWIALQRIKKNACDCAYAINTTCLPRIFLFLTISSISMCATFGVFR